MRTPRTANQGIPLGRAALVLGLAIWTVSLLRTPLPALGGSFIHLIKWEAILMALGWLHLDHAIAKAAWYCGAALMLGSLVYAFAVIRSSSSASAAD